MGSNAYQVNTPKYQLIFADEVIELGARGYTKSMIAAYFGVSVEMLDTWAAKKPAFKEGMSVAMTASQAFHEQKLIQAYDNKDANASLVTNLLRANFGDTYKSSTDSARASKAGVPEKNDYQAEINALIQLLKAAA